MTTRNDAMTTRIWRFEPVDSWFFREGRPFRAVGGAELASRFPPPIRTLAGAVRTLIGERAGVDWRAFAKEENHPLRARIGYGDDLGPLQFHGPWLMRWGERLYPVPGNLLKAKQAGQGDAALQRLRPTAPLRCDLGPAVCLPAVDEPGYGPLENAWLTGQGFQSLRAGGLPAAEDLLLADDLFTEEPRLGIVVDRQRRTVEQGRLYQARHLRLREGISVGVSVTGDEGIAAPATIRFGGAGRLAHVTCTDGDGPMTPPPPSPAEKAGGLILTLLTPSGGAPQNGWLPGNGFREETHAGCTTWRGALAGIDLRIVSGAVGRASREGSWDMLKNRPRPATGQLPPGACWFALVADATPLEQAVQRLSGISIETDPAQQKLGRGLLVAGYWPQHEIPNGLRKE